MHENKKVAAILAVVPAWIIILVIGIVNPDEPEQHKAFILMQYAFFILVCCARLSFNVMIDPAERNFDAQQLAQKFFFDVLSSALLFWMFGCSLADIDNLF